MSWEFTTIINQQEAQKLWKSKMRRKKLAERRAKKAAKDGFTKQKEEQKCTISLKRLLLKI